MDGSHPVMPADIPDMEVAVDDRNLGEVNKEIAINLKINKESCPVCNKVTGSYYEAVIQPRYISSPSFSVSILEMKELGSFLFRFFINFTIVSFASSRIFPI